MALSRKLLEGMGIEDKQVESIIEAHLETVNGLKAERDKLKEKADKAKDLQRQLDESKSAESGASEWQAKYEAERKAFEEYKAGIDAKAAGEAKASAYRKQVLSKAGVADMYLDDIMGVASIDGIELDEDGNVVGAEELVNSAREKWGAFVTKTKTTTSEPATPPKPNGGIEGADPDIARHMRERNERMYGIKDTKE